MKAVYFGLIVSLVSMNAMAGKEKVTANIINTLIANDTVEDLRVYTSRTITLIKKESVRNETTIEEGKISKISESDVTKAIILESTKGKILDVADDVLVVTFDEDCKSNDCAYLFTLNKKGQYALSSVPNKNLGDKVEYGFFGIAKSSSIPFMNRVPTLEFKAQDLVLINKAKQFAPGVKE